MGRTKEYYHDQMLIDQRVEFERAEAVYCELHELGLSDLAELIKSGGDPQNIERGRLVEIVRRLCREPRLAHELLQHHVEASEVAIIGQRKKSLEKFANLLSDSQYFAKQQAALGNNARDEDVWQSFFESNYWIFGYGLTYCLNTPLEGKKLEQVVSGYDFANTGKRVDALLKSRGMISTLSFGEIKTNKTKLIKKVKEAYRRESWQISDELAGGIAQIQRSAQRSIKNLQTKVNVKDSEGAPTKEDLFLVNPKCFLVIGSLSEFQAENGINEEKYSSFELFRRSIISPEIITFDELYERAKFIVATNQDQIDERTLENRSDSK